MMAFIRLITLALVLASNTAWSSHPSESARDQYEAREDRPQPQLLTEATDHRPGVHMSRHSNFIKKLAASNTKVTVPDLQVGCGDGFIQEKLQEPSETAKNSTQPPKKRKPSGSRRRRSYTAWSNQISYDVPYQSISVWQPPTYQLSRPYYVPIYGVSGRVPIYFPPQPLAFNPGVPKDNPVKRPFKGPSYLPPGEPTTSSTTMKIEDRFNGGDNMDDRPVWGLSGEGNQQTQNPQRPQRPTRRPPTTAVAPTRKTRPPGVPRTPPPVLHNPTDPEGFPNSQNEALIPPPEPEPEPEPTVPPTVPTPSQNRPPSRPNNEPSRCVWAIISCCSTANQISYECFDQRGCPGAFWDNNPCDNEFAQAAIAAALNYYNKK